jgi:hypothetical protein
MLLLHLTYESSRNLVVAVEASISRGLWVREDSRARESGSVGYQSPARVESSGLRPKRLDLPSGEGMELMRAE